jgi:hypothetical protein
MKKLSQENYFFGRVEFFLTVREEYRPGMFKYGVLMRISGSKKEEVRDGWRKTA